MKDSGANDTCVLVMGSALGEAAGVRERPGAPGFLPVRTRTRNRTTFQTGVNRCEVTEAALTPINPLPR